MRNLLACLIICGVLASCATTPEAMDRQDSATIQSLVNSGKALELAKRSSLPFVIDQEIVPLADDVRASWQSLLAAGLKVDAGHPGKSSDLGPDSSREFADSMDMRMFFKKYLDPKARLLRLNTPNGQEILFLVRNEWGITTIYGMKGPY